LPFCGKWYKIELWFIFTMYEWSWWKW
jgi:hypothetical protein